jgi:hypothetical protein
MLETHQAGRSPDRPIATHIKGSRDARCRFGMVTVIQRPDRTVGKIAKALIFCGQNAFACRAETRIGRDVKWRGAVKESSRAYQRIRIAPCQFERVPRFEASNIALITLAATSNLRLARAMGASIAKGPNRAQPCGNTCKTAPRRAGLVCAQRLRRPCHQMAAARPESAACGWPPRRAYRPLRSCGRVAEGGGLLNRYRVVKPYRGFESLRLRHPSPVRPGDMGNRSYLRQG